MFNSHAVVSSTNIKNIDIDNNKAIIMMQDEREGAFCTNSPSAYWGLDLREDSDNMLYGLILTAISVGRPVIILGGGECLDTLSIERIKKVVFKS